MTAPGATLKGARAAFLVFVFRIFVFFFFFFMFFPRGLFFSFALFLRRFFFWGRWRRRRGGGRCGGARARRGAGPWAFVAAAVGVGALGLEEEEGSVAAGALLGSAAALTACQVPPKLLSPCPLACPFAWSPEKR